MAWRAFIALPNGGNARNAEMEPVPESGTIEWAPAGAGQARAANMINLAARFGRAGAPARSSEGPRCRSKRVASEEGSEHKWLTEMQMRR